MTKRTSIYLNPPIEKALKGADSISGQLGRICDRYTEANRRARIAQRFTEAELNAFRDCCNGTLFEPSQLIDGAILANFEDSLQDGIADKWEIDAQATAEKLRGLTFSEQVALVDDIESFWRKVANAGD